MHIVLASTSARRQQLLQTAGVVFDTMAIEIDESWYENETADDYIIRMVTSKAKYATQTLTLTHTALVLTADTIAVLPTGEVLGKPTNQKHAFAMWDKLSDATHEIWTAVCACIVSNGQILYQKTLKVATQVQFVPLTETQKYRYWQTGEPKDKAGAYAIQGGAMAWVKSIRGSYTNVVGLPLAETLSLIDEMFKEYHS